MRRDDGAGGVLALAIVGAILSVTLAALALGSALVARQKAVSAADAAALAAGDVLLGVVPGDACAVAADVAAAHSLDLASCRLEGLEAIVTIRLTVLGLPVAVVSRAGPPG
ncbi:Rv3654c family TadE-like protein [Homoserinibacter sp. GY 40078]|uniref:Rv3654c family TadE-like protein n=1 Tax=Homoserinibacter sp. GY 40078 TaxID=2603275 RepID=UPI001650673D|nr:Rv3654c family TadE-like protein [Homoserinibacter sp. GY 40078]